MLNYVKSIKPQNFLLYWLRLEARIVVAKHNRIKPVIQPVRWNIVIRKYFTVENGANKFKVFVSVVCVCCHNKPSPELFCFKSPHPILACDVKNALSIVIYCSTGDSYAAPDVVKIISRCDNSIPKVYLVIPESFFYLCLELCL